MAFWMAAAMLGSSVMSYMGDAANAKAQKKIQAYKNKMLNIAAALSQNSVTTNEILSSAQSARQAIAIRRDEMSTLASTSVSAAAAGVRGKSVNLSLIDVQRNAGNAEKDRQRDLAQSYLQYDQQRQNISLQAVQGQDLSYIPTPKLGTYLLSAATNYMSSTGGGR